jgi:hypothetical protein
MMFPAQSKEQEKDSYASVRMSFSVKVVGVCIFFIHGDRLCIYAHICITMRPRQQGSVMIRLRKG